MNILTLCFRYGKHKSSDRCVRAGHTGRSGCVAGGDPVRAEVRVLFPVPMGLDQSPPPR